MKKPPKPEFEYFGKIDIHTIRKNAEIKRNKIATDEREKLKKLHWHHCAECGMELEELPFKGMMIYKCFNCEGVFLKAGTLEKLCGEESHLLEALFNIFKF